MSDTDGLADTATPEGSPHERTEEAVGRWNLAPRDRGLREAAAFDRLCDDMSAILIAERRDRARGHGSVRVHHRDTRALDQLETNARKSRDRQRRRRQQHEQAAAAALSHFEEVG